MIFVKPRNIKVIRKIAERGKAKPLPCWMRKKIIMTHVFGSDKMLKAS